jgi:Tfp pilus assembly protein PilX
MNPGRHKRAQGATLVVSMIMLILITLIAVTSFRLSSGNLAVVGNMQQRSQAQAAAQNAIEQVITNPLFTADPSHAVTSPCNGNANTLCTDVNGDGVNDIVVQVGSVPASGTISSAPCLQQAKPVMNSSLDLSNANDASCVIGVGQTFGVTGSSSGTSLCTDMLWEVDAQATDASSQAVSVVSAGVKVRSAADDANATYNCQ